MPNFYSSKFTFDPNKPIDGPRLRDAKTCLRWVLSLQPDHQLAKKILDTLDFIDSDTNDKPPDSSELFMALHSSELKRSSPIIQPSGMPEDIKENLQKAGEYYMKAEFKKSLEYLLKAWEQGPKFSIVASNLAIVYVQLNERSKAIDISKEAIDIWPHQDVDLYMILSDNLLKEKRVAEAIKIADQAVQIVPNDPLTWYSLGNALAASGKKGEALNAYRQTIRFAKPWSFLDAKARDAITDLFDEKYKIAERTGSSMYTPPPPKKTKEQWLIDGVNHYVAKQYQQAIADFDRAIQLDPHFIAAYHFRGRAYSDLKQYQQAIADYNRAIQLDPQYTKAYYNRGNAYYSLKQYQQAITDYEHVIQLDPQHTNARYAREQVLHRLRGE